jgi:hypothetical protein
MGAVLSYRVYRPAPRKGEKGTGAIKTEREIRAEVTKAFDEARDQAAWENGHGGYSGTIAELHGSITWVDRSLKSDDEAIDYLDEHHRKWDGPMAVSFMYSPGKGKRRLKGWVVGGLCSE